MPRNRRREILFSVCPAPCDRENIKKNLWLFIWTAKNMATFLTTPLSRRCYFPSQYIHILYVLHEGLQGEGQRESGHTLIHCKEQAKEMLGMWVIMTFQSEKVEGGSDNVTFLRKRASD